MGAPRAPVPQTGALTGLRYAPPRQVACSVGQVAPGRAVLHVLLQVLEPSSALKSHRRAAGARVAAGNSKLCRASERQEAEKGASRTSPIPSTIVSSQGGAEGMG
jgi:hypothetical protein